MSDQPMGSFGLGREGFSDQMEVVAEAIEIAEVATRRYSAAHTGAPMFSAQMTINLPSSAHISQLRDEFLEVCDQLNLDAILEPVKS